MMPVVTILSVGPGDPDFLNEKTKRLLLARDSGIPLVLRTRHHSLSAFLDSRNIPYRTLDDLYDRFENFDDLSAAIADAVWQTASETGSVIYAVPDALTDHSVDALYAKCPPSGKVQSIPGFSYADYYRSACRGFLPTADIRICPAADFDGFSLDPSRPVLITELNDPITAGEVKTALSIYVDDETPVFFFSADGTPHSVPLFELDRQAHYDHLSAVAVPGTDVMNRRWKTLNDLLNIMDILRSPDGCPWDRVQTHQSLKPYLVEEAWEVVDAIEQQDSIHLAEELGDLLFQIVFHASIGKSFDEFTMTDIISGITDKMIRRHPHVFNNGAPADGFSEAAWDRIKQAEQGTDSLADSLEAVSPALPSLRYAEKVIRKARNSLNQPVSAESVLSSLQEKTGRFCSAEPDSRGILLGQILFLCAELAQFYGIDSEVLLHDTVKTVIQRCRVLEKDGKNGSISPGLLDF